MGKRYANRKRKGSATVPPMPPRQEDEYLKTINFLSPYILPRRSNALKVRIPKKSGAPLIAPLVLKGVKVLKDILSNLWKLSFCDHDTKKQKYLDKKNYMVKVRDTSNELKKLVPMEWARGLEQSRILSLLYMSHFG